MKYYNIISNPLINSKLKFDSKYVDFTKLLKMKTLAANFMILLCNIKNLLAFSLVNSQVVKHI